MRKSTQHRYARRLAAAGLTTGAVGAALLVAPTAAFAAVTLPPVVAPGGTVTISDTVALTGGTNVQITTAATCNAKFTAPSTAIVNAASQTVNTGDRVLTFALPAAGTTNAPTVGTNGQAKRHTACLYTGNVAGTSDLVASAAFPFYVGNAPTLNPTLGVTGGGNTLTITAPDSAPIFTNVTTVGAAFMVGDCTAAYGTPATGMSATVTKTSNTVASLTVPSGVVATTAAPTPYSLCLYNGNAGTSALISGAVYQASTISLSQTIGPWGGGNGLNITSPNAFLAGITNPGVIFVPSATACPARYATTSTLDTQVVVPEADVRRLSDMRMALTVPPLLSGAPSDPTTWKICAYNGQTTGGSGSTLIASAPYAITVVPSATAVTPKAGPALGKSRITVTGTAFPTTSGSITATLGGTPLTDITPISSTAFAATTPQHAPANNVTLVVTTESGSSQLNNAYSYTSALVVSPNTAPNTRAIDVIVNGVGFQSANWNTGQGGAHIYLVRGTYASSANGSVRANAPVVECRNVLVLGDTELICNLNLTRRLDSTVAGDTVLEAPAASTALTTVGATVGSRVITSTTEFTQSMVGQVLTQTGNANIVPDTTITSVINSSTALMSNPAKATAATVATLSIAPPVVRTGISATAATAAGVTTLSGAATGTFTSADIGRSIVASGGRISAVTSDGTGATATAGGAPLTDGAVTIDLYRGYLSVPEGAYNLTYVSNGNVGAVASDASYVQSVISSPSTFTVASF